MPKRKASADDYASDDGFIANDSEAPDRASKRSKATAAKSSHFATSLKTQIDADGNEYWELSKMRRVTISEFKGMQMISIREYYDKDGKVLPGKKGISMTLEQYSVFVELLPRIEGVLRKKGERVPRPSYGDAGAAKDEDEEAEMEASNGDGDMRKSNIEATSDEDED